jgi:O-antigen/teichoic acid export membrane protein
VISVMNRTVTAGRRYVSGLSSETRKGLSGLSWSYSTQFAQLFLRLGSSLILSRLLLPSDYGVFGTVMTFLFFMEFLSDIGLRPVIVRSPHGDSPVFLGTAWTVIFIRACGLSLLTLTLSFALPMMGYDSAITPVLQVLAFRPFLIAIQNPTLYVLFRHINYKIPFVLDVTQTFFSIPVTLLLAWWLRSQWALVFGILFGDVFRVVLTHILCPKAPRPTWERSAALELWHFGVSIFFNTIAYGGWLYLDRLAGPRYLPTDQFGLYIAAWTLAEAADNLIGRGSEVFYSMLNRKPEGEERLQFFLSISQKAGWVVGPIFALAALMAPILYRTLYAETFYAAAILLGILTARLIFRSISHLQFMYLMSIGKVNISTRSYVASLIILVASFPFLVDEFGVLGLALTSLVSMSTYTIFQTAQMCRLGLAKSFPTWAALLWTIIATAGVMAMNASRG